MYTYIICIYVYTYMGGKIIYICWENHRSKCQIFQQAMCDCQRVCMIFLEDHRMISEIGIEAAPNGDIYLI